VTSQAINPGSLQDILHRYDTDKDTVHSYGPVYEHLLSPHRETVADVLEIGISSGGSLRAWREYFPTATVHGLDIDPDSLFAECRIRTYHAHQARHDELTAALGDLTFDLIVDDGSHKLNHQVLSLFLLLPRVRPGGLYVVEDLQDPGYMNHFRLLGAEVYDRRHVKGRYDDILIVMRPTMS
jgi:8-demethyl-8-alpha-L-rhamnosyltetracenomycin-C 2'-O-methyltransferase